MPRYYVVTPAFSRREDMSDYGSDVVEVEADTVRAAKVAGLRELRRQYPHGWLYEIYPANPFKGLKVENIDAMEAAESAADNADAEALHEEQMGKDLPIMTEDF